MSDIVVNIQLTDEQFRQAFTRVKREVEAGEAAINRSMARARVGLRLLGLGSATAAVATLRRMILAAAESNELYNESLKQTVETANELSKTIGGLFFEAQLAVDRAIHGGEGQVKELLEARKAEMRSIADMDAAIASLSARDLTRALRLEALGGARSEIEALREQARHRDRRREIGQITHDLQRQNELMLEMAQHAANLAAIERSRAERMKQTAEAARRAAEAVRQEESDALLRRLRAGARGDAGFDLIASSLEINAHFDRRRAEALRDESVPEERRRANAAAIERTRLHELGALADEYNQHLRRRGQELERVVTLAEQEAAVAAKRAAGKEQEAEADAARLRFAQQIREIEESGLSPQARARLVSRLIAARDLTIEAIEERERSGRGRIGGGATLMGTAVGVGTGIEAQVFGRGQMSRSAAAERQTAQATERTAKLMEEANRLLSSINNKLGGGMPAVLD